HSTIYGAIYLALFMHVKRTWRHWISKKIKSENQNSLFNDMNQLLNIDYENNVDITINQFIQKW
ncbi:5749_t:CDS:2, partial [Gigaspora rosea]